MYGQGQLLQLKWSFIMFFLAFAQGVRAYQELLHNLVTMTKSEDPKVRESALILRADVFYEPEYRELCMQQLSLYQPEKMSMGEWIMLSWNYRDSVFES